MGTRAVKEATKEKLMLLASNIAASIDSEMLNQIHSPHDEQSKNYFMLQKQLQRSEHANLGKLRYVYAIVKRDGRYIFVVDATPNHRKDHSSIGDIFRIQDFPLAARGFIKPTAEDRISYDKEFKIYSQSGYAPIKDRKGKTVGVIGVDMDVTTLHHEESRMRNAARTAMAVAILLAILSGSLFSRYLTKPITTLVQSIRRITGGDLETTILMNRHDEFGELADDFNQMTQDLKRSHESLKQYSIELEEKIAKRTAELTKINKEMKDILDHMSQAIFTIDDNFRFNPQHSKFAHLLFGEKPFAGRNILDLLFGPESCPEREDLAYWLQMVFNQTFMQWKDLEAIQPVQDMAIKIISADGQEESKYIDLRFRPIIDRNPDEVQKVMVIIKDNTEKKMLEQKVKQQERDYKDNINQIMEIIKADQDLFKDFITECQEQLILVEPKLINLRNDPTNLTLVNDLFRIMHTIKGNAQVFKLERIAAEAHAVEGIFSIIRSGERVMDDALLNECFSMVDHFKILFNETLEIYQRILYKKGLDMGKTRTEKRISEDSKILKVRAEDIHRLAQLVKKLDLILSENSPQICASDQEKLNAIHGLLDETEQQLRALRKVRVGQIFPRFPRIVRDISMELGKHVTFITSGEDCCIDKYIFEHIGDPMIHLIRNALDHGIEMPEERITAGKPMEGKIRLDVSIDQSELLIVVKDDGRGLDIEEIKKKALEKGIISNEAFLALSDDQAARLIFTPGFSTVEIATGISGRGVGMDVVKNYIEDKLGGKVILESQKNQGLTVKLIVPLPEEAVTV